MKDLRPLHSEVFMKARTALETAVQDLLAAGWEEGLRRNTCEMAVALRQAARDAGWHETESTLRVVESLLALPSREALSIRQALREKLGELLGLLRKVPASRSA